MIAKDLATVSFASAADWLAWLDAEHDRSPGVWLVIAKKGAPTPSVTYAEALDGALRYGWIDGQKAARDQHVWLQRFTPRAPRSRWSRLNRDKAVALIGEGLMRPAGLRQVELAQADGRWDAAYAGQATAEVPDDLRAALDADPGAAAFFATLTGANRYAILYRVQDAKRPETRAKRIEQYVALCREHRTLH